MTEEPILFPRLRKRIQERREERRKRKEGSTEDSEIWVVHEKDVETLKRIDPRVKVLEKVPSKMYAREVYMYEVRIPKDKVDELRRALGLKSSSQITAPTETRDLVDLVRSQFDFTCSICEDIAEKVSSKVSNRTDRMKVYEAVYKLSSGDKKAQNEAIATLGELNVLKPVMDEIKEGWERIKGEKLD